MDSDAAAGPDCDQLAGGAQVVEPRSARLDPARGQPRDRLLRREEAGLDLGDGVEGLAPAHESGLAI